MNGILAIARKDLLQISRDKAGAFWRFGFPLVMAVFFGMVFGGGGGNGGFSGVPVIVVDEDQSEVSTEFLDGLAKRDALFLHRHTGGEEQRPYTKEEAREQVRRGDKTAFLILPEGFGASLENPFLEDPPEVEIGIDPSRGMAGALLEGLLMQETFVTLQTRLMSTEKLDTLVDGWLGDIETAEDTGETAEDTGEAAAFRTYLGSLKTFISEVPVESWRAEETADGESENGGQESDSMWSPVRVKKSEVAREREGPQSGFEVSFPQAVIWALLGGGATFGLSLIVERNRGTLLRLQCSPLNRVQILAGKSLAAVVSLIATALLLMILATVAFGVRPSSWTLLVLSIVSGAWMFTGLVMLLAQFGKTEEAASGITWAVLMLFSMFGGGMIPLFVMPSWMQAASKLSPIRWVAISVEGCLWRDFTAAEMVFPLLLLVLIGTVTFAAGARKMRWT